MDNKSLKVGRFCAAEKFKNMSNVTLTTEIE